MVEGDVVDNRVVVHTKDTSTSSIQIPILNQTNYIVLSIKIKAAFRVHGILDSLEPKNSDPIDVKKNDMAVSLLFQEIPETLVLQVAQYETAKEIWEALKIRYIGAERVREARLGTLDSEFEALKMHSSESIDEFAAKLSNLVSKANSLGHIYEEKKLGTGSSTESQGKLLFNKATSSYKNRSSENSNNKGGGQNSQSRGSKGRDTGQNKNSKNTPDSHSDRHKNKGKDCSKVQCFRCDQFGHFASICPERKKKQDQDSNKQESNLTQTEDVDPDLFMVQCNLESVFLNEEKVIPSRFDDESREEEIWYLDNGASNHMTGNSTYFSEINERITGKVKFGDGSCVEIKGKGSIILNTKNGEHRLLTEIEDPAWLWHARLGHLNFDSLKILSTKGMVHGHSIMSSTPPPSPNASGHKAPVLSSPEPKRRWTTSIDQGEPSNARALEYALNWDVYPHMIQRWIEMGDVPSPYFGSASSSSTLPSLPCTMEQAFAAFVSYMLKELSFVQDATEEIPKLLENGPQVEKNKVGVEHLTTELAATDHVHNLLVDRVAHLETRADTMDGDMEGVLERLAAMEAQLHVANHTAEGLQGRVTHLEAQLQAALFSEYIPVSDDEEEPFEDEPFEEEPFEEEPVEEEPVEIDDAQSYVSFDDEEA
ncbi:hypothetical protein L1987_56686 [Smallanthus sonchifolius]|uniref:Uncharacterized protein n=1 Tax=Smallanthus sonchifolius TaxID=185202 RepID=A0ACB9EDI2_9ASTR|nr:hypothetical protein L1987_56686 [Smallanthus sonchifolius]